MKNIWKQIHNKPAWILNLVIVVLEIIGFVIAIGNNGILILGLYTQESNFVLLVASLLYVAFSVKMAYRRVKKTSDSNEGEMKMLSQNSSHSLPYGITLLRYISTCLVAVTFTVVLFCFVPICVPNMGIGGGLYAMMWDDSSKFHHFICPVLSLVSYLGFERDLVPGKKESFFAMLPTLCYAIVSTSLNVAKVIEGPYPFLYVYRQPVYQSVIWFFAIPGGGWLFALFVAFLARRAKRRK